MDRFVAYRLEQLKTTHPLLRLVYAVAGLGVLGVLLMLGTLFFVVFAALALIGGSIIAMRVWWLSRKAERQLGAAARSARTQQTRDGSVIEGEFFVIETHTEQSEDR